MTQNEIEIVSYEYIEEQTPSEESTPKSSQIRRQGTIKTIEKIAPEILKNNLNNFLNAMDEAFSQTRTTVGDYSLDEIEFSVEVNGKGNIGFLGTGIELGGKGGFKIKLRKKNE